MTLVVEVVAGGGHGEVRRDSRRGMTTTSPPRTSLHTSMSSRGGQRGVDALESEALGVTLAGRTS